jgi:hypothetical protein
LRGRIGRLVLLSEVTGKIASPPEDGRAFPLLPAEVEHLIAFDHLQMAPREREAISLFTL